jgi:hypothetical protein
MFQVFVVVYVPVPTAHASADGTEQCKQLDSYAADCRKSSERNEPLPFSTHTFYTKRDLNCNKGFKWFKMRGRVLRMAFLPYCEEITFMGSDVSYNILHGVLLLEAFINVIFN